MLRKPQHPGVESRVPAASEAGLGTRSVRGPMPPRGFGTKAPTRGSPRLRCYAKIMLAGSIQALTWFSSVDAPSQRIAREQGCSRGRMAHGACSPLAFNAVRVCGPCRGHGRSSADEKLRREAKYRPWMSRVRANDGHESRSLPAENMALKSTLAQKPAAPILGT